MSRCEIHWEGKRPPTRTELRAIASGVRSGLIRCGDSVQPSRARRNPSPAQHAYTDFHWGRAPRRRRGVTLPNLTELFELGQLRGVEYSTKKGQTEAVWVHSFSYPYPSLTATPDGKLGPIVGGKARVTRRGIEG